MNDSVIHLFHRSFYAGLDRVIIVDRASHSTSLKTKRPLFTPSKKKEKYKNPVTCLVVQLFRINTN